MKDVTKLLESAGLAVKALTKSTSFNPDAEPHIKMVQEQKNDFTAATARYFSLLSSIDVRLRRQIYALEEAEIIPAETASKDTQTTQNESLAFPDLEGAPNMPFTKQTGASRYTSKSTGQSNLDVGWLNSRNDNVGKEMEAELWAKAKAFVDTLEQRQAKSSEGDTSVLISEN